MRSQGGDGERQLLRAEHDQLFEQDQDAQPDRIPLIGQQPAGPIPVARLLTKHGDDIVRISHGEKVGDDLQHFLVGRLPRCGGSYGFIW